MNISIFCISRDCPLKGVCQRAAKDTIRKYNGKTSFIAAPFTMIDGQFECSMFSGNSNDVLNLNLKMMISHKN